MSSSNTGGERPTSDGKETVNNFSDQLDGMFNMSDGGNIEQLSQTLAAKRQTITTKSKELQELEERLKATENALQQKAGPTPSAQTASTTSKTANGTSGAPGSSRGK